MFPSIQCYTDWRVCVASFQRVCGLPNSLGGYVFQSCCKSCQVYRFLLKIFCPFSVLIGGLGGITWSVLARAIPVFHSYHFIPYYVVIIRQLSLPSSSLRLVLSVHCMLLLALVHTRHSIILLIFITKVSLKIYRIGVAYNNSWSTVPRLPIMYIASKH